MNPWSAKKPTGTALMLVDDVVDNLPFVVRRDHRIVAAFARQAAAVDWAESRSYHDESRFTQADRAGRVATLRGRQQGRAGIAAVDTGEVARVTEAKGLGRDADAAPVHQRTRHHGHDNGALEQLLARIHKNLDSTSC